MSISALVDPKGLFALLLKNQCVEEGRGLQEPFLMHLVAICEGGRLWLSQKGLSMLPNTQF